MLKATAHSNQLYFVEILFNYHLAFTSHSIIVVSKVLIFSEHKQSPFREHGFLAFHMPVVTASDLGAVVKRDRGNVAMYWQEVNLIDDQRYRSMVKPFECPPRRMEEHALKEAILGSFKARILINGNCANFF